MKRLLLSAAIWLIAATAIAQPIELVGPSQPLDHWRNATIAVVGVEPEEAGRCEVTCVPDTAAIRKLRDWGGRPILDFESGTPGTYTITVTMHGWSQTLHDALDELETAADRAELSDPDTATLTKAVADLTTLVSQFDETYPLREGSCVVEVAGTVPPPIKPPVEPPGPNEISQVIYVWEKSLGPVPLMADALLKQINKDHPEVIARQLEKDEADGDGNNPPSDYKVAHTAALAAGLPCFVVVGSDGSAKTYKTVDEVKEVLP